MTPELNAKIAIWRAKAVEGTLTLEEMREAVLAMREGRKGASVTSEQSRRTKAKAQIKSADEMLDELGSI